MLIFTNGDAVAQGLREAGVTLEIYPWRDVLHEGPVPALPLRELSEFRSLWLAEQGWGEDRAIRKYFRLRDAALVKSRRHQQTELFFEHDLYDQLQLLQVLGELAIRKADPHRYLLPPLDEWVSVEGFRGLGQLSPDQLDNLRDTMEPVTAEQFELAREAWDAFRATDPSALVRLAAELDETAPMPYLGAALRRFLAQYPEVGTGLDRIERQILEALRERSIPLEGLFEVVQEREAVPYLGDQPFYSYLAGLETADPPLIDVHERDFPRPDVYAWITEEGRRCLAGELDLARTPGWYRFLGGVELENDDVESGPAWRWDPETETLVPG